MNLIGIESISDRLNFNLWRKHSQRMHKNPFFRRYITNYCLSSNGCRRNENKRGKKGKKISYFSQFVIQSFKNNNKIRLASLPSWINVECYNYNSSEGARKASFLGSVWATISFYFEDCFWANHNYILMDTHIRSFDGINVRRFQIQSVSRLYEIQ